MNPETGTTLGGRYTLTDRIAAGGMGDVWRATDSVLGRVVAVKVMRAAVSADPTFAERFRDEARHTASLAHQNIATTYDYGEDDGTAYLVMELVDGEPLSAIIARGPVPPSRVRSILGQAALALAAAHAAGVVHRDVKPANILVTADGRVKLTDFGIARAVDGASHTRTGEVLGTPQYLSPEQALGRVTTGASDLYALGIIGQEMLTGRKPFEAGSAVATALMQVNDAPPPLPDTVPTDLRDVIEQCLLKNPENRPRSAAALAAALGMPVAGLATVPAATEVVHTGDTDPAGTQVLGPQERPGTPTSVIPAAYPEYEAGYDPGYEDGVPQPRYAEEPPKKRGIGLWWLPIIVAVLAIGFFLYSFVSNNRTTPAPTPSTASSSAPTTTTSAPSTTTSAPPTTSTPPSTTTTTTTTTSAPATANIVASDFVGRPVGEAKSILVSYKFPESAIIVSEKNAASPAGTVLDISPTGRVALTSTVTLTVSNGNATGGP